MYVMGKATKFANYLYLLEFSYNNGYMSSLKMTPFGRKLKTTISWDSSINKLILGPNMLIEIGHVVQKVKKNWKTTKDGQKSFAYLKRTCLKNLMWGIMYT